MSDETNDANLNTSGRRLSHCEAERDTARAELERARGLLEYVASLACRKTSLANKWGLGLTAIRRFLDARPTREAPTRELCDHPDCTDAMCHPNCKAAAEGTPMSDETKNDPGIVLKLVELFSRAALDGKGLGDRQCIEAIHDLVVPLVPDPIGYDQILLVK